MLFSGWSKVGGCIVLSVQVDNRMVCGRVSTYAVENCYVRGLRSVISVSSSGKRKRAMVLFKWACCISFVGVQDTQHAKQKDAPPRI